jgi:hypothetical protein
VKNWHSFHKQSCYQIFELLINYLHNYFNFSHFFLRKYLLTHNIGSGTKNIPSGNSLAATNLAVVQTVGGLGRRHGGHGRVGARVDFNIPFRPKIQEKLASVLLLSYCH